jgi:hypothetical protein
MLTDYRKPSVCHEELTTRCSNLQSNLGFVVTATTDSKFQVVKYRFSTAQAEKERKRDQELPIDHLLNLGRELLGLAVQHTDTSKALTSLSQWLEILVPEGSYRERKRCADLLLREGYAGRFGESGKVRRLQWPRPRSRGGGRYVRRGGERAPPQERPLGARRSAPRRRSAAEPRDGRGGGGEHGRGLLPALPKGGTDVTRILEGLDLDQSRFDLVIHS